ncbi:MAG TPA: hypothetical protein VHV55_25180 [Pirellulales bacterium]|nr:hypothetical protein [Pirellulales bacterium]
MRRMLILAVMLIAGLAMLAETASARCHHRRRSNSCYSGCGYNTGCNTGGCSSGGNMGGCYNGGCATGCNPGRPAAPMGAPAAPTYAPPAPAPAAGS